MGIMNDVVNMLDFDREHIETDESTKLKIELIKSYFNFSRIER